MRKPIYIRIRSIVQISLLVTFFLFLSVPSVHSDSVVFSTAGPDTFVVPAGVTSITVKTWGGGGGGGETDGSTGGAGGGGGFAQADIAVTPLETLLIRVGAGGGAGSGNQAAGEGGGGGGLTGVFRTSVSQANALVIAGSGAGGGGGDNGTGGPGGAGGAGGGASGTAGTAAGAGAGGDYGDQSAGGSGGGGTDGSALTGGKGTNGSGTAGSASNNGGADNGGDGGNSGSTSGGGGGGGGGYFGGEGGDTTTGTGNSGGGGGGGSGYVTGTNTTLTAGSGTSVPNSGDSDYGGSAGVGGGAGTAGNAGRIVIIYTPADTDGNLSASATITEPVAISSIADTSGERVAVLDFTISDGGTADGLSLNVSQIVLNTSGTGTFSDITWQLNGPDASYVTGTVGAGTITFSSLSISVADGDDSPGETYTVYAYFSTLPTSTEDQTFILSVDGDTDLTVSGSGSQMGTTSAVTNGSGSTMNVVHTKLIFSTQPPSSAVIDTDFSGTIAVSATDVNNNVDTDFSENITISAVITVTHAAPSGTLTSTDSGGTTKSPTNGTATWTDTKYDVGETIDIKAVSATTYTTGIFSTAVLVTCSDATLGGTLADGATEAQIVAGSQTLTITLSGDTWVTAGAAFNAQRQNIINGLDSNSTEAAGWDAIVQANMDVTDVVRTSATVVTITLGAEVDYNITAKETITVTAPGTAVTSGCAHEGASTFSISHTAQPMGQPDASVYDTAGSDTFTVPACVRSITVKAWGAGGGGGETDGSAGGAGGGGGFSQADIAVTPGETLLIRVGEGGGAGSGNQAAGEGGGGGGLTGVFRSSVSQANGLVIAGSGAGGGGDNGTGAPGGAGGAGGGDAGTVGIAAGAGAGGDYGDQSAGGSGGGGTDGSALTGGKGTNGAGTAGSASNNGGADNGGDGGNSGSTSGGGGGGGGGYFGGEGGDTVTGTGNSGGGGGGGSGYVTGTNTTSTAGSGTAVANSTDSDYGGSAGAGAAADASGSAGRIVIIYETQDTGYAYNRKLRINHSHVAGTADHDNYPALISLSGNWLKTTAADATNGRIQNDNGWDIIFKDDDGNPLDHEIEDYDGTAGTLVAWVRIPTLKATENTDIYMHYGNACISASQENKNGVWNINYKSVWHLEENVTDEQTSGSHEDSTSKNNHGDQNNNAVWTAGKIAAAQDFDGNNDYIDLGTGTPYPTDARSAFTFETWVYLDTSPGTSDQFGIWAIRDSTPTPLETEFIFGIGDWTVDDRYIKATSYNGSSYDNNYSDSQVSLQTWTHIGVVYDGSSTVYFYVNGEPDGSTAFTEPAYETDCSQLIGALVSGGNYIDGKIDELRISDTNRSADWIKTSHANQNDPGDWNSPGFYTVFPEHPTCGYDYRRQITIDNTQVSGTADLTDFPALISLAGVSYLSSAYVTDADGDDIIFVGEDGRQLDHEVESYAQTGSDGTLVAWVRIPTLKYDEDTVIYMLYGNDCVDESLANPEGVWNDNYLMVHHLNQSSGTLNDSTQYDHDSNSETGMTYQQTGKIAESLLFDESNDYYDVSDFDYGDSLTVSMWVKVTDNVGSYYQYFYSHDVNNTNPSINMNLSEDSATNPDDLQVRMGDDGTSDEDGLADVSAGDINATDGSWHYVTLTRVKNGTNNLYIDGQSQDTSSGANTAIDPAGNIYIGRRQDGDADRYFGGNLDEIRISNTERSAGWIATSHNNQSSPGTFYSVDSDEEEACAYTYEKQITIDHSEVAGSSDLTNFPLLVSLSGNWLKTTTADPTNGRIESVADTDCPTGGCDIIFMDADGVTQLDHEIETYDGTNGTLVAWVRIPTLYYDRDTVITMWYGNDCIKFPTEHPTAVWDDNFLMVHHLNQSSGTLNDSTQYNRDSNSETGMTYQSTGKISDALFFDESDDYYDISDFDYGDTFTVSMWVKVSDNVGSYYQFFYSHDVNDTNPSISILFNEDSATNPDDLQVRMGDNGTNDEDIFTDVSAGDTNATDGSWHYVTLTRVQNGTNNLYIDAASQATSSGANTAIDPVGNINIGRRQNGDANRYFGGYLDEIRISNTERSAGWIETAFNNQDDPGDVGSPGFYSIAGECDGDYSYRRSITIDGSDVSGTSGTLDNFPLLVSLSGNWLKTTTADAVNGSIENTNGYDIVFRDSDARTQLDHEIEKYDGNAGTLVAWVRIPSLDKVDANETKIYMYYGNCGITASQENVSGVWDDNFLMVHHLIQSSGTLNDSTQYDRDSNSETGMTYGSAGKISDCLLFDESDDYYTIADFDYGDTFTVSMWVKVSDNVGSYYQYFYSHDVVNTNPSLNLDFFEDNAGSGEPDDLIVNMGDNGSNDEDMLDDVSAGDTNATDGSWHYITVTRVRNGTNNLYIDAASQATSSGANTAIDPAGNINIGRRQDGNADRYFGGYLDEIRISNTERDADWIATSHDNQNNPGDVGSPGFYTVGALESSVTLAAFATAVDLIAFTATGRDNAVVVAWETAQEINNMGFYLYRAGNPAGPFEKLTDQLIGGTNYSVMGRAYYFEDRDLVPGRLYYYKLEDLDSDGTRTIHGPICVDWDGDGMPDDWEMAHGLNPALDDGALDFDGDGLSNRQEYERGTDPFNADSDGDGIADGQDLKRDRDEAFDGRSLTRGVQVLAADETGMTLELRTDGFAAREVAAGERSFERLTVDDYIHGFSSAIGQPELPMKGLLLDLPQGKSATLTILGTAGQAHAGYQIYPVPQTVVRGQGDRAHVAEVFAIDEQAYAADSLYPAAAARLGPTYVWRGDQKLQLQFYPLAFNPAAGSLVHYARIRVRIDYADMSAQARSAGTADHRVTPWRPPADNSARALTAAFSRGLAAALKSPGGISASGIGIGLVPIVAAAVWSPPDEAAAYKISVTDEGIYRLSRSELAAAGIAVDGLDLSRVRIYNLGREIAIRIDDANGDDTLDNGDFIEFYATAVDSQYTKYARNNIYWLTTGGGSGSPRRMAQMDGTPGPAALAASHGAAVRHENYYVYSSKAPGADGLERWFSGGALGDGVEFGPLAGNFSLAVPDVVGGRGRLTLSLYSAYNTEHAAAVSLNGVAVGTFTWSGIGFYEATIDPVNLVSGSNTVTIDCNTSVDAILLDWIEVGYTRDFIAAGDVLKFSHAAGYRYQIISFTDPDLVAYDITTPGNVQQVVNFDTYAGLNPYTIEFEDPVGGADRTFLVLTQAQVKSVAGISPDTASSLYDTANGADYILITHQDIGWDGDGNARQWLTDLVALREGQGLRVMVADVADVFDEFSYGLQSAQALKDFLTYAYNNYSGDAPKYVVLVGDSTYDPKNIWGSMGLPDTTPYVPTYLITTRLMGETASDEWFVRINDGDALADMYIGRLPARTASEAAGMVAKIVAYESAPNSKTWQRNLVLLADNQREGEEYEYEATFEAMNEDAAALLPAGVNEPFRGYLADYLAAADLTTDIKERINDHGALIVNYSGHGSQRIWAAEEIFNDTDVADLTNSALPFFVSMNCLTGYSITPEGLGAGAISLAEALMRSEYGALAALMPTGLSTPTGQHILNSGLFEAIFSEDVRVLGDALAGAKQTLMANEVADFADGRYDEVIATFVLFGDPATTLKVPLPTRPTAPTAQAGDAVVSLQWQAAADCNGDAVAGYNVYRSTTIGGVYAKINSAPLTVGVGAALTPAEMAALVTATEFTDDTAANDTTYYYVVKAVDADGDESVRSAAVSATPTAVPARNLTGSGGGGGGGGAGCFISTTQK